MQLDDYKWQSGPCSDSLDLYVCCGDDTSASCCAEICQWVLYVTHSHLHSNRRLTRTSRLFNIMRVTSTTFSWPNGRKEWWIYEWVREAVGCMGRHGGRAQVSIKKRWWKVQLAATATIKYYGKGTFIKLDEPRRGLEGKVTTFIGPT